MAEEHYHKQSHDLWQVLVLGSTTFSAMLEAQYSHKFHFISASASPLPLHQFLTAHHYEPSSFPALLSLGAYPDVTADILQLLPSLSLIVTNSTGIDHIDLLECRRRGVQVANAGTVFSEDVADVAVGLLIDVTRKLSAADRYMRTTLRPAGSWYFPLGSKLGAKRVGLVGLGSIGMEVAKRLEAFGCIILYHSRNKKPLVPYPFYSSVLDLAATSDALLVCCALNKQTHHIINREVMLALGERGIIVNVGRGSHIDEKELVKCLIEGKVGGAGLDVFKNEPHVPKVLFALDNVVLSPHSAAFSSESLMDNVKLVAGNLEAFLSKKPLITPVNIFD